MKISVSYNFNNGVVEEDTATILLENVSVAHIKRVLSELSEMSVKDFAKLGASSVYSSPESTESFRTNIESFLIDCCSPEENPE